MMRRRRAYGQYAGALSRAVQKGAGLTVSSRILEAEYALTQLRAERDWVLTVADDIASGRLAWP
jgi:hypothetical protein